MSANPFDLARQWPDRSTETPLFRSRPWYWLGMLNGEDHVFRGEVPVALIPSDAERQPLDRHDIECRACTFRPPTMLSLRGLCAERKIVMHAVWFEVAKRLDRENPLPRPPLTAGQVWASDATAWIDVTEDGVVEFLITRVRRWASGEFIAYGERETFVDWEKMTGGAVLIRGSGAFWADTSAPLPWEEDTTS